MRYCYYQSLCLRKDAFLRLISLFVALLCIQHVSDAFMAFTRTARLPRRCSTNVFFLSMIDSSVSVGFIGCGTIAKAIATGLATQDEVAISSVAVSRRSAQKSEALQESFPDLVTVHDDNQGVVDRSDIVFVTVLPKQTSSVLQALSFDETRHSLVSLVVSESCSSPGMDIYGCGNAPHNHFPF